MIPQTINKRDALHARSHLDSQIALLERLLTLPELLLEAEQAKFGDKWLTSQKATNNNKRRRGIIEAMNTELEALKSEKEKLV